MTSKQNSWAPQFGAAVLATLLLGFAFLGGASVPQKQPYTTWSDYAGSADTMQYSALKQINKSNVNRLELAWFYPAPGPSGRFSWNPLIVDGVMFVGGKDYAIVALEAATGKEIWSRPTEGRITHRGVNYWESKDRSDRRIIFADNNYLQQLNARTGVTINTFGNDGKVDLREGIPRARGIQSGTPGRVFENLIILGSAGGEEYGSPPGDLRAFDVLTGKLVWTFRTIPHPGEYGYETWPPDAWKYAGGANAWGEISLDEKRGIAYFALGSPTYDFYGADRIGANLYGDTLLALDARTGKRLWHYQLLHHDLWDYDLVTGPKLLTVRHKGRMVDIVAEPTKWGLLFVFNRVTGEPLWPIEQRPVPKSDVPGEEAYPTQPFPTKPPPFARLTFTADDINPYVDPEEKSRLRDILLNARNEGIFTPPTSTRHQIQIPGEYGGCNWGGAAGDPETGMLYVRTTDAPTIHKLVERSPTEQSGDGSPEQRGRAVYVQLCEPCHAGRAGIRSPKELGVDRYKNIIRRGQGQMVGIDEKTLTPQSLDMLLAYLDNPAAAAAPRTPRPEAPPPPPGQVRYSGQFGNMLNANNGLPSISPPWSELVAYDLNEGTIKWRIPVGTAPGLAAKGIRNTGSFRATRNGPVVTAGGLIFMATAGDRTVRAYDKETGKVLWEKELESNPEGIPSVYEVGGRQYVAFWASSARTTENMAWKRGKPEAQGYYVFALPGRASGAKR